MKRIISISLILILLLGCTAIYSNAAEVNYCDKIQRAVNSLYFWGVGSNVSEGVSFDNSTIIDYTFSFFQNDTYLSNIRQEDYGPVECFTVAADKFEAKAKELFAVVDVDNLRAAKGVFGKYNTDTNIYYFEVFGGWGDPGCYIISGYSKSGNKLTAYLGYWEGMDFLSSTDGLTLGRDYLIYDNKYVAAEKSNWLKVVVDATGSNIRFHSWERIEYTEAPISGLITVTTKFEEEPVSSAPVSSEPSSNSTPSSSVQPTVTPDINTNSTPAPEISSNVSSEVSDVTTESSQVSSKVSSEPAEDLKPIATIDGAIIEAASDTFPEGTVVSVLAVTEGDLFNTVKSALTEKANKFIAFDITAKNEYVSVQPDGTVKATFTIPKDYDLSKVCVLYIDDNGKYEMIPYTIDKDNNTVTATLSHFSAYAVTEMNEVVNPDLAEKETANPYLTIIIIAAVALVLAGGIAAWYFLIFKKQKEKISE